MAIWLWKVGIVSKFINNNEKKFPFFDADRGLLMKAFFLFFFTSEMIYFWERDDHQF